MVEKGPVMTAQGAFRSRTTYRAADDCCGRSPNLHLYGVRLVLTYHNQGWLADNHQRGCLVPSLPLVSRQRSTVTGYALEEPTYRTVGWLKLSRLAPGSSSCEPTGGRGGGEAYRGPPWALPKSRHHFRYCSPFVEIWIPVRAHVFQGCCSFCPQLTHL